MYRVDKRFYRTTEILRWMVVVFETERKFTRNHAEDMIDGLAKGCNEAGKYFMDVLISTSFIFSTIGIKIQKTRFVSWENPHKEVAVSIRNAATPLITAMKGGPQLIVVVLPEGGNDLYTAVKQ